MSSSLKDKLTSSLHETAWSIPADSFVQLLQSTSMQSDDCMTKACKPPIKRYSFVDRQDRILHLFISVFILIGQWCTSVFSILTKYPDSTRHFNSSSSRISIVRLAIHWGIQLTESIRLSLANSDNWKKENYEFYMDNI